MRSPAATLVAARETRSTGLAMVRESRAASTTDSAPAAASPTTRERIWALRKLLKPRSTTSLSAGRKLPGKFPGKRAGAERANPTSDLGGQFAELAGYDRYLRDGDRNQRHDSHRHHGEHQSGGQSVHGRSRSR